MKLIIIIFLVLFIPVMLYTSCNNTETTRKKTELNTSGINYMHLKWKLDPRYVLPRGPENSFDSRVVGDPCIIWDEDINTWRMFYFAGGSKGSQTGIAISKSDEEIGPGDWKKAGEINYTNPEAKLNPSSAHKFEVIMDPYKPNHTSKIKGKYWGIFTTNNKGNKHIQVAWAEKLSGPWTIREKPILSPDDNFIDGRHCDTPAAYWFEEKNYVAVFYKAYPKLSQERMQPESPFGSATVLAYWHPDDSVAVKAAILNRPGQNDAWNKGWMSSPMIFYDQKNEYWYALTNGSPTPPIDDSHREPAPCLGGWIICSGNRLDDKWYSDSINSPLIHIEDLSEDEKKAGIGVNLWSHHLLVTPQGQARIFVNSGEYGTEQMYSYVSQ